jgi:membrane peptidoglycan carboxypeptidase
VPAGTFHGSCFPDGVYPDGPWDFSNDNGGDKGNIPVLQVYNHSVNGGVVSMAQQLDVCKIFDGAEALGVHRAAKLTSEDQFMKSFPNYGTTKLTRVPSNVYGGIDEIAPITMAAAYAAFAGGGKYCSPTPIDRIVGPDGKNVPFTGSACKQAIPPDIAAGVASVLQGAVTRGLAGHARSDIGVPHFAATGATDGVRDNWTVGASSTVANATWVGNAGPICDSAGKNCDRVTIRSDSSLQRANERIWPAVMNEADRIYGGDNFPDPSEAMSKRPVVPVPDVAGKSYDEAARILSNAGFQVTKGEEKDSLEKKGTVAGTDPTGSTTSGAMITVFISKGTQAKVPDVLGLDYGEAVQKLAEAGLGADGRCIIGSSSRPGSQDLVLNTSPDAGTGVKRGTTVTVQADCRTRR